MYQHDTPDKHLFAHDKRAYSHGCMRVQDPLKYGEVLLSLVLPNEHYTAERLQKMFGGSEVNINFPQFLPVHLTYQTAFVDDGKLVIRDDVYGRDARMLPLLKGSERKIADIAIDRPRGSSSAPVRMPPGTFGGSGGGGGGSFFERLFGAPEPRAPRPRARLAAPTIAGTSSAKRHDRIHHSIAPCTARGDFFLRSAPPDGVRFAFPPRYFRSKQTPFAPAEAGAQTWPSADPRDGHPIARCAMGTPRGDERAIQKMLL